MHQSRLEIEQLCLRIPGLSKDEAQQLSRDVGRYLVERLPAGIAPRNTASLRLTVNIDRNTPKERLAQRIAEQIFKSLL